jgi:uncharacterized protein (DUF342 family)
MKRYPLIGKLAIKNKFLSKEELDNALEACSGTGNDLDQELTRYLVSNKLVSSKNIEKLTSSIKTLKDQKPEMKFGAIAIKEDLISKNNLDFILEEQENDIINSRKPKFIGDMLIEAGLISGKQRDLVLEEQKKLIKEIEEFPDNEEDGKEKIPLLLEPELVSHGLNLQLSGDFLSAFFLKTEEFDKSCTVNDIKDILIDRDIIFGIVTDEMIISFLKFHGFKDKPFRIAHGIKPVHGQNAKIDCFFDTEHLKAGGVDTDGQIDFKDRGKIPQIDKEMVLAEKTQMIEAVPGKNIYGETISVEPVVDRKIKFGKGTKLSKNGLQVLSTVKGHPKITSAGEISVQEEYVINGDVDYETGHIEYGGNINIKGCIKSGFQVKGNSIKAFEIDDGIIDAQGDLKISNGINSGEIFVKGDLSAKFIHKSNITCEGEVSVNKEIIDAAIENRGMCSMTAGKVISSDISSKMGVFVKDIGTEKGKPSTIRVGFDMFSEKELQINKISIEDFNEVLDEMVKSKEKKKEEKETIERKIDEYTQIKNNSLSIQQKLISKIDSLKKGDEKIDYPEAIKEKFNELRTEILQAQGKLEFYLENTEELEKQIKELTQKLGKQRLKIKNLEFERESIIKWIENNPGKPVITASGVIMAKTIVKGIHSSKILENEVKTVQLKEVRDTKPGVGPNAYKIEIID